MKKSVLILFALLFATVSYGKVNVIVSVIP